MKHNISDLLDNVYVDDIEMKTLAPISPRHIKAKVMNQVDKKKTGVVRWLGRIAAAAAVFALMTLTAFAADSVLNDGAAFASISAEISDGIFFFKSEWSGEGVKESTTVFTGSQKDLMDDMDRYFEESISSNGATITPIRAIADDTNYYLYLRVQAPEGVVLPDLTDEYYYDFGYRGRPEYEMEIQYQPLPSYKPCEDVWRDMGFTYWARPIEDEDPTDNVKDFVIRFSLDKGSIPFNGSYPKKLIIRRLSILKKMDPSGDQKLVEGFFCFDITINNENRDGQSLVIDTGELSFYNKEYDYTTTVKNVVITPLSIELDCTYTQPSDKYIFPYGGPVQIVMKDGSTIEVLEAYYNAQEHSYPHPDSIVAVGSSSSFDEPIVVGEIDYLVFNGEHIVDVN